MFMLCDFRLFSPPFLSASFPCCHSCSLWVFFFVLLLPFLLPSSCVLPFFWSSLLFFFLLCSFFPSFYTCCAFSCVSFSSQKESFFSRTHHAPQSLLLRAGAERANIPDVEQDEEEVEDVAAMEVDATVEQKMQQLEEDAKTPAGARMSRADRRKSVQWSERIESTSPAVSSSEEAAAPTSILTQKHKQCAPHEEEEEEEEEDEDTRPRLKTPLRNEIAQAVAAKKLEAGASSSIPKLKTPLRREIAQAAADKKKKNANKGGEQGCVFFLF